MREQIFQFKYETFLLSELTGIELSLVEESFNCFNKSYAPYSQFLVSAVALLADGQIVSAGNQENASYGATICAERALLSTISAQFTNQIIKAICVNYSPLNQTSFSKPISPCGICRQVLLEQESKQNQEIIIYLTGPNKDVIKIASAKHLLPHYFGSEYLS
ncbi:MAG: cytidine deaminase [Sediminibacterium sp.]|nr:cytidine deaminase [Sediminibacterium sp.]